MSPLVEEANEYVRYLHNACMGIRGLPRRIRTETTLRPDGAKERQHFNSERHTYLFEVELDEVNKKLSDLQDGIKAIRVWRGYDPTLAEENRKLRGWIFFFGMVALLCFVNMVEANKSGKTGM